MGSAEVCKANIQNIKDLTVAQISANRKKASLKASNNVSMSINPSS